MIPWQPKAQCMVCPVSIMAGHPLEATLKWKTVSLLLICHLGPQVLGAERDRPRAHPPMVWQHRHPRLVSRQRVTRSVVPTKIRRNH